MVEKLPPHKYVTFKMEFVSAVDHPAQEPARALIVTKRNPDPPAKPQEPKMDPTQEIATLKSTLAAVAKRQEQIFGLTGTQFEVFRALTEKQQDDFLAASPTAREVITQKALDDDPVIATIDGVAIRKSAGPVAVTMAKALVREREESLAAREAASVVVYKGRVATECSNYPLTDVQAIEALVALDGIKNVEIREAVKKAWGAGNTALGDAGKPTGRTTGDVRVGKGLVDGNPEEVYVANVRKYAADQKISVAAAYSDYAKTDQGKKEEAAARAAKKRRDRQVAEDNDEGDGDDEP